MKDIACDLALIYTREKYLEFLQKEQNKPFDDRADNQDLLALGELAEIFKHAYKILKNINFED